MEIFVANTSKVVFLNGVPSRIWEGHTAKGVKVHAYITRIAVAEGEDQTEFERELESHRVPSPEIAAIPLRLLI